MNFLPEQQESAGVSPEADHRSSGRGLGSAILLAAMALPGLMPAAHAENAPESAEIGIRYLDYKDSSRMLDGSGTAGAYAFGNPGVQDRVKVHAPSVNFLLPFAGSWSLAGSLVSDSVSGSSPRYYNSAPTRYFSEHRTAGDWKFTRYFSRSSYAVTFVHSDEHDYSSRALAGTATFASDDNNTTWTVGAGYSRDKITPTGGGTDPVTGDPFALERKYGRDFMLGVTQVLTPNDIIQSNVTYAQGRGYFSDPYKTGDYRPRERNQFAWLTRWNHFIEEGPSLLKGTTLKTSYRYYQDTWGVKAHTLSGEWVKPLADGWTVTPLLRFSDQGSARFYQDPNPATPGMPVETFFNNPTTGAYQSADARLSAFGAVTYGVRVAKRLADGWTADFRGELYEQRSAWRLVGQGSPGLDPFKARFLQVGLTKKF